MIKLIVYQIDSFTKERFKGNPAGVVVNAEGLSDEQMLMIARELNNSDTAFLFPPNDDNCDGVIRYFTPKIEIPACGHATIAAMYVKALEENLESCILRFKTLNGILPFEITKVDNDYQVTIAQGKFELNPPFDDITSHKIIDALGLTNSDLDERCPIQIASTGYSKVMIGIKSREKLNSLTPDFQSLIDISKQIKCNGYFVFTFDSDNKDILTYARMFAPINGINEDPVTGNANGPLGGYLLQNKIIKITGDTFEFIGRQGEAMGRLGTISVKVTLNNGEISLIQLKGDAVKVFKTVIEI
jgi:PhzF family phenazine biosynthesis protein